MINLRPYQIKAEQLLYDWFNKNETGNPVLNLPGGSGKSVIIASIVKNAINQWPDTRVLMLVHSKKLIEQNYNKLKSIWRQAPVGVYSAGLNKRCLTEQITYAGIQSVWKRANSIGHIDLLLVDESHAISATETGTYRKLIADLMAINPKMRIVGFSASPYRLGTGLLTEGEYAIFHDIIEPVTIQELVNQKYLAPLKSKKAKNSFDVSGLHKRVGDYIPSEMDRRFNTSDNNINVVQEIIKHSEQYRHILIFCTTISHSENIAKLFNQQGVNAESLTSNSADGDLILKRFESGQTKVLCNVGMLTTGWDFPNLDCIVFLRKTTSPGLYLQMAVRGMRIKEHTDYCRVLDFVGIVEELGPVTEVRPPKRSGEREGAPPLKMCDNCFEIVPISVMKCPECGFEFLKPEKAELSLHNDDIMGLSGTEMLVNSWHWRTQKSKSKDIEMLVCTHYGASLSDKPITSYHCVLHDGFAGTKARSELFQIAANANIELRTFANDHSLEKIAERLNDAKCPDSLEYRLDGKFHRILKRTWHLKRNSQID